MSDYGSMGEYQVQQQQPYYGGYGQFGGQNWNQQPPSEKIIPLVPAPTNETWFKDRWRPAIAWQYFTVCLFDFIIAPVLTGTFHYITESAVNYEQWQPLTLQTGGFYHVSMAAIIGVYAWSRGQEKLKNVA